MNWFICRLQVVLLSKRCIPFVHRDKPIMKGHTWRNYHKLQQQPQLSICNILQGASAPVNTGEKTHLLSVGSVHSSFGLTNKFWGVLAGGPNLSYFVDEPLRKSWKVKISGFCLKMFQLKKSLDVDGLIMSKLK